MAAGYLWALVPAVLILVGAASRLFDSFENRRPNCSCCLASSVVVGAGVDLYDPKSSLVRASQSVLRIICSYVALFLWRAWLGNDDQQQDAFSIYYRCALGRLGAE